MDYLHPSAGPERLGDLSNLALAYLGDGVYELMVRTYLCLHGKTTNKGLHKASLDFVAAPAQAKRAKGLLPLLTEEEREVFRRGRNASPHTIPPHASRGDYQAATALEALFGYLYLTGRQERLQDLFSHLLEEAVP